MQHHYTLSSNQAYISATPLHPISFTFSRMHIYQWQTDPTPSSNRAKMYAKPLHPISFTYRRMHIYPWHMDPKLTIDPCYTVTSKRFHILQDAHIPMTDWPPCQLTIDACNTVTPHKSHIVHNAHISMADPYTKAVSHVVECHGRLTPPLLQSSRDVCKTLTLNKFYI